MSARQSIGRVARVVAASAALTLGGCSGGSTGPPYGVTSSVVSHEMTQDIQVWAPDAEGEFPVVTGIHGLGGAKEDWDVLATQLAEQGVVVFVADYRSTSSPDLMQQDLVCASRYMRTIASEFGGSTDQPWVVVGHSLGAYIALNTLDAEQYGPGGTYTACLEGQPSPDAIVAMNGCYSEVGLDPSTLGSIGTPLTLVAADQDQTCPVSESEAAAAALQAAGYPTSLVTIPNAGHLVSIFHDVVDGQFTTLATDDPGGQTAVQAILDAIDAVRS